MTPYPNPTQGNQLYIQYNAEENGSVLVNVYDINGHLVKQQQAFVGTGQETLAIDMASLVQGSYFIELRQGNQKEVAKFTVR